MNVVLLSVLPLSFECRRIRIHELWNRMWNAECLFPPHSLLICTTPRAVDTAKWWWKKNDEKNHHTHELTEIPFFSFVVSVRWCFLNFHSAFQTYNDVRFYHSFKSLFPLLLLLLILVEKRKKQLSVAIFFPSLSSEKKNCFIVSKHEQKNLLVMHGRKLDCYALGNRLVATIFLFSTIHHSSVIVGCIRFDNGSLDHNQIKLLYWIVIMCAL